jgi:hypothetical protein
MYVIKRTDQGGGYVAVSGNSSSYTNSVRRIRKFATEEEAEAHRCPGNEIVLPLSHITGVCSLRT